MDSDDFKRLLLGPTLFRLDAMLAPRLVPILYAVGLMALLVWAVNHLFWTFGSNFGNGLWGLLEIVVFGALWLIILRIACEAVLVFFKAHQPASEEVSRSRISTTLLEEVREAIHDLAEADEDTITISEPVHRPPAPSAPATRPPPPEVIVTPPTAKPVRRTAKRTPPAKT